MLERILVGPLGKGLAATLDESLPKVGVAFTRVGIALGDDTAPAGFHALETDAAGLERRGIAPEKPVLPERLDTLYLDVRAEALAEPVDGDPVEPRGDLLQGRGADHRWAKIGTVRKAGFGVPAQGHVDFEELREPLLGGLPIPFEIERPVVHPGAGPDDDREGFSIRAERGVQVVDSGPSLAVYWLALGAEHGELAVARQGSPFGDPCFLDVGSVQGLDRIDSNPRNAGHAGSSLRWGKSVSSDGRGVEASLTTGACWQSMRKLLTKQSIAALLHPFVHLLATLSNDCLEFLSLLTIKHSKPGEPIRKRIHVFPSNRYSVRPPINYWEIHSSTVTMNRHVDRVITTARAEAFTLLELAVVVAWTGLAGLAWVTAGTRVGATAPGELLQEGIWTSTVVVPLLFALIFLAHAGHDLWRILRCSGFPPESLPAESLPGLICAGWRILETVVAGGLLVVSGLLLPTYVLMTAELGDTGLVYALFIFATLTTVVVAPILAGLLLIRIVGMGLYRTGRLLAEISGDDDVAEASGRDERKETPETDEQTGHRKET